MRASADPVLVTGGSGFIAAALIQALAPRWNVRASQRREARAPNEFVVGEMGEGADWARALDGVGTVVHLAGPSNSYFPDDVIRRGIVGGAEELASQASAAGVKRFIFVSSLKACGGVSDSKPLSEEDPPRPEDAYGRAKLDAEQIFLAQPALTPIVLRPPLVYAANAKGNLSKFLRRLDSGAPLPFGGVKNRRSMIALSSLVRAMTAVLEHPTKPSGVFHVADEPSVSTGEMAALLRQGMGRPARVFPMPGFARIGPPPLVRSLEVDARRFRETFGYPGPAERPPARQQPTPFEMMAGLHDAARGVRHRPSRIVIVFRQHAVLLVEQLFSEEAPDRTRALKMQGVSRRLIEREQRLEEMHLRILTARGSGTDLALFKAALGMFPIPVNPALQALGRCDEIAANLQCVGGFREREQHERRVVEITAFVERPSIRTQQMARAAVGTQCSRQQHFNACAHGAAPRAFQAQPDREGIDHGLACLDAYAARLGRCRRPVKRQALVEAARVAIVTALPPKRQRDRITKCARPLPWRAAPTVAFDLACRSWQLHNVLRSQAKSMQLPETSEQKGKGCVGGAPVILVTGATGFVGAALIASLRARGASVLGGYRRVGEAGLDGRVVGELGEETDWSRTLDGVDIVVHAAGPAHAKQSKQEAQRAIVGGAFSLARAATRAGVKRLIFISSIRACVDATANAGADEQTACSSVDPYGLAKREAESTFRSERSLRTVILRPPLVIGAQAKANFAAFLRILDSDLPLPFAKLHNKRNIVSLASLTEAVGLVIEAADDLSGGVFHVADQPAVSTCEMASLLRQGMGRAKRLFAAPGVELIAPRPLVRSLEVNDARLRSVFGYRGQDARAALLACGRAWLER